MSRRDTVRTNYDAINALIDNHKVYRGNNTSFCIDMGFEKRTSWVSDLKRNRNLPSPEEAVRMCQLLNTTPEKILMHEGKDEKRQMPGGYQKGAGAAGAGGAKRKRPRP